MCACECNIQWAICGLCDEFFRFCAQRAELSDLVSEFQDRRSAEEREPPAFEVQPGRMPLCAVRDRKKFEGAKTKCSKANCDRRLPLGSYVCFSETRAQTVC